MPLIAYLLLIVLADHVGGPAGLALLAVAVIGIATLKPGN